VRTSTDFSGLVDPPGDALSPRPGGPSGADGAGAAIWAGAGVAGFVACGSTGEAAALDTHEQLALLDTVLAASDGLAGGDGSVGLPPARTPAAGCHPVRAADRRPAGAAAGLHPPLAGGPAAMVPQPGRRCDRAADRLRHPVPTGRHDHTRHAAAAGRHPRIRAVKDCGGPTRERRWPCWPRAAAGAGGRGSADFRLGGTRRSRRDRGQCACGHQRLRAPAAPAARR
jgi:4-hydroxy-tetrahydrodipicolinate synthase